MRPLRAIAIFVRAVVIFVAALVAMMSLLAGLGGDAGVPELVIMFVIALGLAIKLSGRGMSRNAERSA